MPYEEEADEGNLETISTGQSKIEDGQARWMFDNSLDFMEIHARLQGGRLTYDKSKGMYVVKRVQGVAPLMNEKGITETMSTINLAVTKIHALSDLDLEVILSMTRGFGRELTKLYAVNMIKFGMTPEKASLVNEIVVSLFHANLRRSFGGAAMKALRDTERVIESRQTVQKQGLLRRIF